MDLVTLVTACSLTIDPKVMHALIWHQSGGEPWSFTVPGERQSRVYQYARDAVRAVRDTDRDNTPIRVGLTGVSVQPRSVNAMIFAPCTNVAIAAQQVAELRERCKTSQRLNGEPIYCAMAAYRGSWERPDSAFADAVRTSVVKNDAPNFEMPDDTSLDSGEISSAMPSAFHGVAATPIIAPDDRQRAWLSRLFPAKPLQSDSPSSDGSTAATSAAGAQGSDTPNAAPTPATAHADGLFVPKSGQRRSP